MIINLFTILPLTCAVFVFFLGVYIFSQGMHSRLHQLLTAFCACMVFWLFGTFMMFAVRGNIAAAVFWDRFVYAGVILMPPLMQHLSLLFTGRFSRQKPLLVVNYLVALFFLGLVFTPYFVDGLYVYSWGAHSKAQFWHHIFLLYFFLATSVFFRNSIVFYRETSDKQKRAQTLSMILAFGLVMTIGGTAYLYAYGIDTKFPFGYITGFTFPIILFYSLIRHEFLDSKVLKTEMLVGATNFILVTLIFLSDTIERVLIQLFFALGVTAVGVFLIRSVREEVNRRKEVSELAQSLQEANRRLQELDRQKTEFLSIASHQLRTPLSIIKGYVELIQDGVYGKVTKKMHGILSTIDMSNERLVTLVDEFLDVSRIEQGRTKFVFAPTNLEDQIDHILKDFSGKLTQKKLSVTFTPSTTPVLVDCDGQKIFHVLFNFIDNAIKYTAKGGVKIICTYDAAGTTFQVKDTGLGFAADDDGKFFNKFYRGNNVRGQGIDGTGLGIYVCRQFVEAHGGRVWAKSAGKNKGSEFGFWLPKNPILPESKKVPLPDGVSGIMNQYETTDF